MLTFDPTILDPTTRQAALNAAFDAAGLPHAGHTAQITALKATLDAALPTTIPDTITDVMVGLVTLVGRLYVNGSAVNVIPGEAAIATIATANATDLASAIALANANKATLNTLLAELRTSRILLP